MRREIIYQEKNEMIGTRYKLKKGTSLNDERCKSNSPSFTQMSGR